jgi:predicted signal transduction protein with EAL and GGDEF domain
MTLAPDIRPYMPEVPEARSYQIDRFLIQNLAFNGADAAIVKAMIFLAHSLDMVVIAEGVETEEQLRAIQSLRPDNFSFLRSRSGLSLFPPRNRVRRRDAVFSGPIATANQGKKSGRVVPFQ